MSGLAEPESAALTVPRRGTFVYRETFDVPWLEVCNAAIRRQRRGELVRQQADAILNRHVRDLLNDHVMPHVREAALDFLPKRVPTTAVQIPRRDRDTWRVLTSWGTGGYWCRLRAEVFWIASQRVSGDCVVLRQREWPGFPVAGMDALIADAVRQVPSDDMGTRSGSRLIEEWFHVRVREVLRAVGSSWDRATHHFGRDWPRKGVPQTPPVAQRRIAELEARLSEIKQSLRAVSGTRMWGLLAEQDSLEEQLVQVAVSAPLSSAQHRAARVSGVDQQRADPEAVHVTIVLDPLVFWTVHEG